MAQQISEKKVLIDKANSSMFIALTVSAAIVVFSLMSTRSLIKLSNHKSHVIREKKSVSATLAKNDQEIGRLIDSFKAFDSAPESVIATSEKNSKIVLDALPPKYDFPALATSLEKILTDGGYTINGITGIDNETTESSTSSSSSPQPVEMPFTLTVSGPYAQIKNLPVDLERSIRPIHISMVDLAGTESDARITVTAKTFYQPGKNLELGSKEVK
jgi:hypothetical protein